MASERNFFYELDGFRFLRLPAAGGYSGYNPKRRRSDVATLSTNYSLAWGIVEEETIITLAAPFVSRTEYLSLQERYEAETADGTPYMYRLIAPDAELTVEIIGVDGHPYHHHYADIAVTMKILSEGGTRLYLTDTNSNVVGAPTGKVSSDTDNGHGPVDKNTCKVLSRFRNTLVNSVIAELDCTGGHSANTYDLARIFLSAPLRGQVFRTGQRFRFYGGIDPKVGYSALDTAAEDAGFRIYPYLWRNGAKVCALYGATSGTTGQNDSAPVYIANAAVQTWQGFELPALTVDVTVNEGDRIALEVWLYRAQASNRMAQITYDGERDTWAEHEGWLGSLNGAASYLEYSGGIVFADGIMG